MAGVMGHCDDSEVSAAPSGVAIRASRAVFCPSIFCMVASASLTSFSRRRIMRLYSFISSYDLRPWLISSWGEGAVIRMFL